MEFGGAKELHRLAIEFANRGPVACQLRDVVVQLLPQSGADGFAGGGNYDEPMRALAWGWRRSGSLSYHRVPGGRRDEGVGGRRFCSP
jgi:hypothetical protein